MKIILDFDDTILNTFQLVVEWEKIFEEAGFTKEEFRKYYHNTKEKEKRGDYEIEEILEIFAKIRLFDKEKVKSNFFSLLGRTREFVYKDLFNFVLSYDIKDLILLSFGTTSSHKIKIENSQVSQFFRETIITKGDKTEKIKEISKKYPAEKIFFIDDKAKQIDEAKKRLPKIIAIKMERPTGRHILPKAELADYVVKNLDEAKKIINELSK